MQGTMLAQTTNTNRISAEGSTTSCIVKGGGTNVPTSTYTNPNATQLCGKFKVYYEDIQLGNGYGFDDPLNSNDMKNTVCAVLTYLQSTFDFSQVPANDPIKIEFRHSYKNPSNPPPFGGGYFNEIAYAEILMPGIINSQSGYYGGYVYDKTTNYALYQSYTYAGIDGRIRLNLEGLSQNSNTSTVDFHCNHNNNVNTCETDLYGTILHEMLHLMGWFSMIDVVPFSLNPIHNNTFSLNQNTYSKLDDAFLYHQANPFANTWVEKWVINSGLGPIINPVLTGTNIAINDRNTYIKATGRFNDNHPVFTQENQWSPNNYNAGIFSHLAEQPLMLGDRYWISPGYIPSYVLSNRIPCGNQRRLITIPELKLLSNLGLPINPTSPSASLLSNHKAECTDDISHAYSTSVSDWTYANTLNYDWMEGKNGITNVTVDYTIPNNGIPLSINLGSLAKIQDIDGDPISLMPGSIVGLRGVGMGGNNHNCLTVSNNNTTITYLPRPNFLGRAQFYFQITDGKEPGAVVLITVDVLPGSNFQNSPTNELIINGGFEEGTEIITNTTTGVLGNSPLNNWTNGLCGSTAFADSHPYSMLSGSALPFPNRMGIMVRNAFDLCDGTITGNNPYPYEYGYYAYTFPTNNVGGFSAPDSKLMPSINNRYEKLTPSPLGEYTHYSTLAQPLTLNKIYQLEFDLYVLPGTTLPSGLLPLRYNLCSDFSRTNPAINQVINHSFGIQYGTWMHLTYQFTYCGSVSSNFLNIENLSTQSDIFIDNLSLVEIPQNPLSVAVSSGFINCSTYALVATAQPLPCGTVTYTWSPATGLSSSTIANPIASNIQTTTTYTVTATNGSNFATATITLNPALTVTATATPPIICPGDNSDLSATGALSYTWQPGSLIGTPVPTSPLTTTVYTVTGTDANGCTATSQTTVTVLPANSLQCLCPGLPPNTFTNPTASGLLAAFGNPANNIIAGQTFGIIGQFTVNSNITFQNCQIYMAMDAEIVVQNPVILKIDAASVMQTPPNCPMWKGIVTNVIGSTVHITKSILRDMSLGVRSVGNFVTSPALNVDNSHFQNNLVGIDCYGIASANMVTIINNTFITTNPNLKDPYTAWSRGEHGIKIRSCLALNIGAATTSTNNFENLFNGIYIMQETGGNIDISYNKYNNIQGGSTLWPSLSNPVGLAFADDHRGCAVYGKNLSQGSPTQLKCFGQYNTALPDFLNCQKGILTNSFSNNIRFNNCLSLDAGFLAYKTENTTNTILSNTIESTYLGVGLWGNMGGGGVSDNTIIVKAHPIVNNPASGSIFWGKGIELGYFNNAQMAWMTANHNIITSEEPEWVIGMMIRNSPYGPRLGNSIRFTPATPPTNTAFSHPTLRGFSITNSNQNRLEDNVIEANYSGNSNPHRSVGIWMHQSPRNYLACNTIDRTQYGMYVVGNNTTGSVLDIVGNNHNPNANTTPTHHVAMLFRHLGTEGTFGNIGDLQHNNKNTFGALSAYSSGFKVFKMCNAMIGDRIYTTPSLLTPFESGGSAACKYSVVQNVALHNEYDCSSRLFVPAPKFSPAEALQIATDGVSYPEYQPVAEWMDENDLYRQLDHDVALRTSNTTLQQFYDVQYQDATRYIAETNDLIDALAQDLTAMSASDYQNLLAEAEQRNSNIVSTATHEQNERTINTLYLRYLRYGSDSLSAADALTIQDLATQCPYIGGMAVYKARTLYALYQPGFYIDDMVVCNAAGVFKNGSGLFDAENELLNGMQTQESNDEDDKNLLKIYPNPTQGVVHIRSELPFDNAKWVLHDMSGRLIAKGILLDKANSGQIALSGLSVGIYRLRLENASKVSIHKLVIE